VHQDQADADHGVADPADPDHHRADGEQHDVDHIEDVLADDVGEGAAAGRGVVIALPGLAAGQDVAFRQAAQAGGRRCGQFGHEENPQERRFWLLAVFY
jgi:hypothetical protein